MPKTTPTLRTREHQGLPEVFVRGDGSAAGTHLRFVGCEDPGTVFRLEIDLDGRAGSPPLATGRAHYVTGDRRPGVLDVYVRFM